MIGKWSRRYVAVAWFLPSGRCPLSQARWYAFSLVGWKVPGICYQSNNIALLVLSADTVSFDDGFLTKLKAAYSPCSYFVDEQTRRKGHRLIQSSSGLQTYHDRLVITRPAHDMRILLLTEYHDNASHPDWRRLLTTIEKILMGTNVFWLQSSLL